MKKMTKILGITAIAAVMLFTMACEGPIGPAGPAGPVDVFTVTFDTGTGGSAIASQKVISGGIAIEPRKKPSKAYTPVTEADLYRLPQFVEWQKDGVAFDFDTPITANTTLTAKWKDQEKLTHTATGGDSFVERAINRISTEGPGEYLIAINADDAGFTNAMPDREINNNTKVTIIGLGSERIISQLDDGIAFILGGPGVTGVSLTLGENIKLVGKAGNGSPLVVVNEGATFTMLAGSTITGNENISMGEAAAVKVVGTFVMKGGTITACGTVAVGITPRSTFVMEGGSISGTSPIIPSISVDVFVERDAACTLSGSATVGNICMIYDTASTTAKFTPVTIVPGWTGGFKLNLIDDVSATITAAKTTWNGKTVLKSSTTTALTSAIIGRVTFGKLILMNPPTFTNANISGPISTTGVLTVN